MRRKIVVALIAFIAAAWIWIALRPSPEDRLADLIAELRARGEPVSLAEMERPMPPDDQNGAYDLDAAMAWFEAHPPEGDWTHTTAGPWNDLLTVPWEETASHEQMEALRELLTFWRPLFEHVDRGADKPEIAWPLPERDTAAGALELGVDVPALQQLSRFLSARALGGATAAERLRAIRSQLAVASHMRARVLLDSLVAAVTRDVGCRELRVSLERGAVDPRPARQELDRLLRTEWDVRFASTVRSERAFMIEVIPFWLDGSAQALLASQRPRPTLGESLRDGARDLLLGRNPLAADKGWAFGFQIEDLRDGERFLDPAYTAHQMWTDGRDPTIELSQFAALLPRIRTKLIQGDAVSRLARLALAAYEHRRVHSEWPVNPDDLQPLVEDDVPLDPYTGERFILERDGDVLVVRAQPWEGIVDEGEDPEEYGFVWRLPPR